ncbi:unnamed protein product, partial [Brassica oleracea]
GLNCDPFDKDEIWDVEHESFWLDMKVPTSEGPTLKELQAVLTICRNWSREKRLMVEAFQRYPWGRVGFSSLLESIKVLTYEKKKSYTLHGCVHVLLIWIFESVPGLGEKFGNRIEGASVPLLSWLGSRPRINFSDFCAQEKRNHGKIRVRHMVVKAIEDRYPKCEDHKVSTELDNMIQDILKGQLDEKFWEVMAATKSKKRKNIVDPPVKEMMEKIAMLVEDIKNLKEKAYVNIHTDVANSNDHNSIAQEEDDDSSNGLVCFLRLFLFVIFLINITNTCILLHKRKEDEVPLKKVKKEKAIVIPELNDISISSKDWQQHLQWEKSEKCRQAIEALTSILEEPTRRRKPQLTKTQQWPFVGNSTVKRIITGVTPSTVRSMQSSSPYASRRIAFLDRWFVKSWVNDFEKQDKNSVELSDMYSKAFNGEYPEQFVTGKKWFKDVDSLFLCHNINGNHWVALHIDLLKSTIYVYDCIPDVVKAHKDLQEECRPFTKMIPLILNKMLPPTKGKKSEQQFALRRPKNVPQNDDPGDCGVYSLKYIECLAIGCTFHGLSDEIIPAQRMKLAAEIYEEVAEVDAEGSI